MLNYTGSIEDVLASGEYDSGDTVTITYDELFDLAEQARLLIQGLVGHSFRFPPVRSDVERKSNRPLHPVLGGKSPYSEFLPL